MLSTMKRNSGNEELGGSKGRKRRKIVTLSLLKRIWLPTELWVDTLRLLPRRELLFHVQPTCRRLHQICERHVPSLHQIERFQHLWDSMQNFLSASGRAAERRLAELTIDAEKAVGISRNTVTDDGTLLGPHFRLDPGQPLVLERRGPTYSIGNYLRVFDDRQRRLLGQCIALFRDCPLLLPLSTFFGHPEELADLALLSRARPYSIHIKFSITKYCISPELLKPDALLRTPLVMRCARVRFHFPVTLWLPTAETFCHWLLYKGEDTDQDQQCDRTRILFTGHIGPSKCAEIVQRCRKNFLKSATAASRRSFLFIFVSPPDIGHDPFLIENNRTGEVLQLDQRESETADQPELVCFHLRRCVATELANSEKLSNRMANTNTTNFDLLGGTPEDDLFWVPNNRGMRAPPVLTIR